ncbi:caspase family protein [Rubrimonas cliftonensis]|uniref:Sel1 repeat-containing protein n=1 Tax=Rubrimonas cliftonensis TaxID=89524 RepID=A0A1H3XFC9_9RHOB|nr:caspase family protein [Rubrimonas cliftonensis]SDZ98107.1 Sel1 repeat-containing protein [Rubrimonas cliftonensis]
MGRASILAAVGACLLCVAAGPASAQEELALERLILRSEIPGLPDRRIDLGERASRRYGVVIGNADYAHVNDLKNAVADAALVAGFLRDRGYEVLERTNLDKLGFEALLRRILRDVDKDTEVVFYFAGHGVQIGAHNFIIPVDARLDGAYDAPFEAVSLDSLIRILGARARLQMIILDSCRDNPFENAEAFVELRGEALPARSGFTTQTAPVNTMLAFSTSPGAVAFDGEGANSPFTGALVAGAAANPEAPVAEILAKVRKDVYRATDGRQVSWDSSTLVEPIYFDAARAYEVAVADGAAGSVSRGVAVAPVAQAEPPAAPGSIRLSARYDREVEIGAALFAGLKAEDVPASSLTLAEPPASGALASAPRQGPRRPLGVGAPLPDGGSLLFVSDADAAAAPQRFELAAPGGAIAVELTLTPDPCDAQAGDHLDPGGVGVAVYANEIDPQAATAACAAAVARSPGTARFHYQLGRARLAARDFPEARASFEKARDLGHARAWQALGDMIAREEAATGGRADLLAPEPALAHYAVGVEQGDPYAFYALGRQLLRYGETSGAREQGYQLMMRALEVGHTFAMNELGAFFLEQGSDHYDPDRALRYYAESAARDDIYGFNNLGLVYANGLGGVTPNGPQALEWFEKAAEAGHPYAPGNIARLHNAGQIGGGPNYAQAVRWYDRGLPRGDAWAGANAAWIIANRRPGGYQPWDAATRAAKTMVLRDAEAAAAARDVLSGLDGRALDGAAQALIDEMGEPLTVDGAFGPASEAAMARLTERLGAPTPPGDRKARLEALARLYWSTRPFRVDLF